MRHCKLWISPWQERGKQTILDTAALDPAGAWPVNLIRHSGRDSLPNNTVLVIIHPADVAHHSLRVEALRPKLAAMCFTQLDDLVALTLIEEAIAADPSLRDKLRWL